MVFPSLCTTFTSINMHNMKKSLIVCLALFLAVSVQAQEDGAKLAKKAGKALTSYNIDPAGNGAKLEEAKTLIDQALQLPDAQALASAWLTKGDVYSTILNRDMGRRVVDPKAPLTGDNNALDAFNAYKMAYEKPDAKKYEKSDALKGMGDVQGALVNLGLDKYDQQLYEKAYMSFSAMLTCHDILHAAAKKSLLDDAAQYDNQMYITALTATLAGKNDIAAPLYETLYKKGSDKPEVYSGLFKAKMDMKDEEGAKKVLEEGRKKFPDDTNLLFDEINIYLKDNKLNELVDRLKAAIAKEPTNIGLYVTLGNVYDQLYQIEYKNKNTTKADEYFGEAKSYYMQAIGKDPKNVDATYAMGALYYNKAAALTQELNAMPEDFSSAGMKKYKTLKDEIMVMFDQALPHFQKAESLDPNDNNTLVALSEIYARKEDEQLTAEFKKRLDTVKGGGKNASSYFKM